MLKQTIRTSKHEPDKESHEAGSLCVVDESMKIFRRANNIMYKNPNTIKNPSFYKPCF